MKTTLLLTSIALVAMGVAVVASSATADDCKIDSKCNPEKYGGRRSSSSSVTVGSYSYWYSTGGNECSGLPRLERALCQQGRRIQGF
jgi:hypothetical protein